MMSAEDNKICLAAADGLCVWANYYGCILDDSQILDFPRPGYGLIFFLPILVAPRGYSRFTEL